MKKTFTWVVVLVLAFLAIIGVIISFGQKNGKIISATPDQTLKIVAAEDMWGSLAGQLAGDKAQVLSIVSDPNADPHEYESTPTTRAPSPTPIW